MSSLALQTGALFAGRYAVRRCLKIGGMGAVYEVTDTRTNAPRALKIMNPEFVEDPELRARFEQEARIVGQVESDHLVRTFDAGIDNETGTPFLVMELLRGEELGALIKRRGALPTEEVLRYLVQAGRAVDKTHAAGIVHRDLKPENLFVTLREDDTPCVKVLDFGIAKIVEHNGLSRLTRAAGTPMFMAPEQIQAKASVGLSVDLYALAQIAYALLVGEPYWREEARALEMFPLFTTILGGPQEMPVARARRRKEVELPPAFDAWFLRATAAQPTDRYKNAAEVVSTLAEALGRGAPARVEQADISLSAMPSHPGAWPIDPRNQPSTSGEPATLISDSRPNTGATAMPVTTPSHSPVTSLPTRSNRPVLAIAAAVTAVLVLVPAVLLMSRASSDDPKALAISPTTTAAAAGAPAATTTVAPVVQTSAETATEAASASPEPSASVAPSATAVAAPSMKPRETKPGPIPTARPSAKRTIF
ncbi:MAG: serine/threonine protein kinase [Polyangiaceae bacterium]|nr:serine/threonine protein kinase [Polyangiaceae bacterium]